MYHPIYHEQIFDREATLEECKMMGAMYVQAIVDSLNKRFLDLLVFNASKLSSPKYYPSGEEVCTTMLEQWLERLIIKFGLTVVESNARRVEFVETLVPLPLILNERLGLVDLFECFSFGWV